jgi:hypothetical protein
MEPTDYLQYRVIVTGLQGQLEDRYQELLREYQDNTNTFQHLSRLIRQLNPRTNFHPNVPNCLWTLGLILLSRQQEIQEELVHIRRIYRQIPPLDLFSNPEQPHTEPLTRGAQAILGPLDLPPQIHQQTSTDDSSSSSSASLPPQVHQHTSSDYSSSSSSASLESSPSSMHYDS